MGILVYPDDNNKPTQPSNDAQREEPNKETFMGKEYYYEIEEYTDLEKNLQLLFQKAHYRGASSDHTLLDIVTDGLQLVHQEVRAVLDRLTEKSVEAQYYIPNSPDDTYTSGEVVRLSTIAAERGKYE